MPSAKETGLLARWSRPFERIVASPNWHRFTLIGRWAMVAGITVWMAVQMTDIGWRAVLAALPTTPWYYILFVVLFLTLPVSEIPVMRLLFGKYVPGLFPALIRKRVLNAALIGYSGDLFLFVWANARGVLPRVRLLERIKDNALLSALASTIFTAALLVAFVVLGRAHWIARWFSSAAGTIGIVAFALLLATPILLRFRKNILSVSFRVASAVVGIHISRLILVALLQATQWAVVLPSEPWSVWITFLTVQMVISRLPVVPNRDLLFLSAALEMSHIADGPRAAMAGLLLAGGALTQGSNLLFFLLTSFERRRGTLPVTQADPAFVGQVAPPTVPPAGP